MPAMALLTVTRWLAGPMIWAAHFLVVYGSESLLCDGSGGASRHMTLVVAATAAALVALLAVTALNWRRTSGQQDDPARSFMDGLAVGLGLTSLVAVAWTALPAAMLPACVPPA